MSFVRVKRTVMDHILGSHPQNQSPQRGTGDEGVMTQGETLNAKT